MNIRQRKDIARYLLSKDNFIQGELETAESLESLAFTSSPCMTLFDFNYPNHLKPAPVEISPKPSKSHSLPKTDVVVITWTVAEAKALSDIFTCPFRPSRNTSTKDWYVYSRNFDSKFKSKIRLGAPSRESSSLGSYFVSTINDKKILCFKSELHLNQDGIRTGEGKATLPVKDLFEQILQETEANHIFTTGTCGATNQRHGLGDVVATRSAKFRLADEFRNEDFNHEIFKSKWNISTTYLENAERFMQSNMKRIREPEVLPPTEKYAFSDKPIVTKQNKADIYLEGLRLPKTSPILTTDYFEFGNSTTNNLFAEGCGVEMGDAVLGLVCDQFGNSAPKWASIRNVSDPVINGNLRADPLSAPNPRIDLQTMWAVWYYETYGYWTSINSALAIWAIIAGI